MFKEEDINANKPLVVKWDKKIVGNDGVEPGILSGVANNFLTRIDDEAKFISLVRYMGLDAPQQDIQHLRVTADLQNMYKLSGDNAGSQVDSLDDLTETVPSVLKDTLQAQPFTAYTSISKAFLKTNIAKESFITEYENILAPSVAFGADKIALFGKNTKADSKGIHALDGILKQLDDINGVDANMGKFTAGVQGNEIVADLDAMLLQFTKNGGKRSEAKIFVSSTAEANLIQALSERETAGGDGLIFNDAGRVMFRGREVVQVDALDKPENGYDEVIIVANPNSIIYAPLLQMESEAEYEVRRKAYITSIDIWFDVAVLYEQDVLYADFTPRT